MSSVPHRRLELLSEPTETVGLERASATALGDSAGEPGYLLVGELAKATGKTVRAIHLYEDLGLLRPHDRSKGRYRLFSNDSVVRVRWIAKLQSLGLSLTEIQDLVRSQADQGSAMFAAARLREVYADKLRETREKLRELALLETELRESLDYLSGCDTSCMPELPTESCHCCARHKDTGDAPDLVAGMRAH
jgi:MerR family copper efflux transcriptional regulator